MKNNQPRIYTEGFSIDPDCQARLDKIVETVETLSPSPDLGIRLLKAGRIYEGLLWGNAGGQTIGVYNCGPSLPQVLETLRRNIRRKYLKSRKNRYGRFVEQARNY